MLIVQVCDFGNDGDSVYRLRAPSQCLAKLPDVTVVDCHFFSRHLLELMDLADVVVLQFVNDWDLLWLCSRRRAAGRVTVFEANDYFFDLQPWNMIAGQWQDPTIRELYLQLLATADGVQTSTDELGRRWRQLGAREVAIFPNQLIEAAALPEIPDRPLTIGWGGSPGHLADWYAVAPMLQQWLDAHPEVHLAVMTGEPGRGFFRLPADRYSFQPFGSLDDYLAFLDRVDIGLAPLLDTAYNRCRSDVKFLEYASRGVAGIYSDLEPYNRSVTPGETGLLYRMPGELITCLESLRTNPQLRHKLRSQGHEYVARNRKLSDHIGQRLTWYRSLVKSPPIGHATSSRDVVVGGRSSFVGWAYSPTEAGGGRVRPPYTELPADLQTARGSAKVPPVPSPVEFLAALLHTTAGEGTGDTSRIAAGSAHPTQVMSGEAESQHDRYIPVPAQEPERKVLEAIAMPSAAEGTRLLAPIVERHPRYLQALQHYGRLLNGRRDCQLALLHLERARALQPDNPHTLSEIGRTYFLLDDRAKAREVLEQAIAIEPRYLPAWQYQLHLLGWERSADGPVWAQRAEAIFGACYPIALLGARTYPPSEQPAVMLRILERFAPLITWSERAVAIAAFRQAVLAVVRIAPGPQSLALLRRACVVFPESAQLAGELGAALLQQGFPAEAFEQQARALDLRRQAAIDRAEFNSDAPVPLDWQFAHHVLATSGEIKPTTDGGNS